MIDKRDDHDKSVAGCEGGSCRTLRVCMIHDCIAPSQCHRGNMGCLARQIFVEGPTAQALNGLNRANKS
jgi:hypothetical protein